MVEQEGVRARSVVIEDLLAFFDRPTRVVDEHNIGLGV